MKAQYTRFETLSSTPLDVRSGLVAWWSFDLSLKDNFVNSDDLSGNGYVINFLANTASGPGAWPGSASLDAQSAGGVSVTLSTITNVYTIMAWVYALSIPGGGTEVQVVNAGTDVFGLSMSAVTAGRLGMWDGTTYTSGATTLAAGRWYHAAVTSDGSTRVLYVNGISDASGGVSGSSIGSTAWYVGTNLGLGRHFPGYIDDVKIFSRALSAEEAFREYAHGIARPHLRPFELDLSILQAQVGVDTLMAQAIM